MKKHLGIGILTTVLMACIGYLLILLNPIVTDPYSAGISSAGWISVETGQSVGTRILAAAGPSLLLFFLGSGISFLIGLPAGVAMGIGGSDHRLLRLGISLASMLPALVTGFLLLRLLSVDLRIFPLSGIQSIDFALMDGRDSGMFPRFSRSLNVLYHATLPAFVIALADGNLVHVLRGASSAVESHQKMGYVDALKLLGMKKRFLVFRYFSRSASVSALAAFRIQLPMVVGGLVVVEKVFSIPGLGSLLVRAVEYNDIPLLKGLILVLSMATGLAYLLFVFVQYLLDPQMRYGLEESPEE